MIMLKRQSKIDPTEPYRFIANLNKVGNRYNQGSSYGGSNAYPRFMLRAEIRTEEPMVL